MIELLQRSTHKSHYIPYAERVPETPVDWRKAAKCTRSGISIYREMSPSLFSCYICGNSYSSLPELRYHEHIQHDTLRCSRFACSDMFPSRKALLNHEHNHHTEMMCSSCQGTVNGAAEIPHHLSEVHGHMIPMICACSTCNIFFGSQQDYSAHLTFCHSLPKYPALVYESSKSLTESPGSSVCKEYPTAPLFATDEDIIRYVQRILDDINATPIGVSQSS
jgi:hypothetical protein